MSTRPLDPTAHRPSMVAVSIRDLRRKLDERAGRPIIRTIRGAGYQIPEGAR